MPKSIVLKLNQQQLQLLDRTIAKGAAANREELILRALRESAAKLAEARSGLGTAR